MERPLFTGIVFICGWETNWVQFCSPLFFFFSFLLVTQYIRYANLEIHVFLILISTPAARAFFLSRATSESSRQFSRKHHLHSCLKWFEIQNMWSPCRIFPYSLGETVLRWVVWINSFCFSVLRHMCVIFLDLFPFYVSAFSSTAFSPLFENVDCVYTPAMDSWIF